MYFFSSILGAMWRDYRWNSDQILSAVVFTETLSWGFRQFFPTGTYAGIGTTFVEFENVMKSATKKKMNVCVAYLFRLSHQLWQTLPLENFLS